MKKFSQLSVAECDLLKCSIQDNSEPAKEEPPYGEWENKTPRQIARDYFTFYYGKSIYNCFIIEMKRTSQ